MPQNTGAPFYHPVTHEYVKTGAWYDGAAHQEHENIEQEVEQNGAQQTDDSGKKEEDPEKEPEPKEKPKKK